VSYERFSKGIMDGKKRVKEEDKKDMKDIIS
jgi:hypothetical protein